MSITTDIYEKHSVLLEYLLFHYGTEEEVLPWSFGPKQALGFAVRSVIKLLHAPLVPDGARALDLGCAVGRSSYELADYCAEVLGIDYSESFIAAAEAIRREGTMPYARLDEAGAYTPLTAVRPRKGNSGSTIRFEQGDAMNLRADLGSFDVVHAANLLCRLREPQRLLDRLPSLVNAGGQLLLTTPCTWLSEYTLLEHFPKGSTLEWLKERLSAGFTLEHQEDIPFLIREHARKYQWSVALGTRWVRR